MWVLDRSFTFTWKGSSAECPHHCLPREFVQHGKMAPDQDDGCALLRVAIIALRIQGPFQLGVQTCSVAAGAGHMLCLTQESKNVASTYQT